MKTFWNEKYETMPLEAMRQFQLEKLRETIAWVYERVPFYREKFEDMGLEPGDVESLEDITRLPFTVKDDLRDNYPFGLCAVPMEEVVQVHASSGTTGKPITGPYTESDLEQWTECCARVMWSQGFRPGDVCQNALTMGLFTGGLGIHQPLRRIGCAIVPSGGGFTDRQIMLMQDFRVTAWASTPSYALTVAERAEKVGVDLRKLPLRLAIVGAEPFTVEMKQAIEERMGVTSGEMYGLTEMMGPGVGGSCLEGRLHLNEDHVYAEVIDPATGESLPEGSQGELVFTALQRRAMPLLRYRSRDISILGREKCDCGRTLISLEKIMGRSDDMLIISGVNVYPSQVESVILEFSELEPVYQIKVFKKGHLDAMTVMAEPRAEVHGLGADSLAGLQRQVADRFSQVIGIKVPVDLQGPGGIPRSEGKAARVIDERQA